MSQANSDIQEATNQSADLVYRVIGGGQSITIAATNVTGGIGGNNSGALKTATLSFPLSDLTASDIFGAITNLTVTTGDGSTYAGTGTPTYTFGIYVEVDGTQYKCGEMSGRPKSIVDALSAYFANGGINLFKNSGKVFNNTDTLIVIIKTLKRTVTTIAEEYNLKTATLGGQYI